MKKIDIRPLEGKLGVMFVGLGAVTTTVIAGISAIKKGLGQPYGSMTQMGYIRLGKRTENRNVPVSELLPIETLGNLVFAAWDIFPDNGYEAAVKAGVLEKTLLEQLKPELSQIVPMKGVFEQNYVKRLTGTHVKETSSKRQQVKELVEDIRRFKDSQQLSRCVVIWCASTEIYQELGAVHQTLKALENGLDTDDPRISPSMIYAYAAMSEGLPYINGAPNLTVDTPALLELANLKRVPIAGKDFKTGQTLMKTILAPGLKARLLGLNGWFSTNILGNRDGEVLDDPEAFKSKEKSKLSVLDTILQPSLYPDLYGKFSHLVRINYYPPRGDQKEGWDNIDIFGWLGYPMQIKIDFLCRDSILAAPVVLDLVLFMDLAHRANKYGIQEWLSFYFKSPMAAENLYPEHDLFIQLTKLKNTLRFMAGEELITHLGYEYYEGMKESR